MSNSNLLPHALWLLSIPEAAARVHGQHARGRISVGSSRLLNSSSSRSRNSSNAADGPSGLLVAGLFTEAIVFAKRAIHRLANTDRPQGTSWTPLAFCESLAECQQDVLPALALFRRAVKTATGSATVTDSTDRVAGNVGVTACYLMLSIGYSDPRDATSSALDALRGLSEVLWTAACISPDDGSSEGATTLLKLRVVTESCQDCLLSLCMYALVCLQRCLKANPEACCREACILLQMMQNLPGADAGLSFAADIAGHLKGDSKFGINSSSDQFGRIIQKAAASLELGLQPVSTTAQARASETTSGAAARSASCLKAALEGAQRLLSEELRQRGVAAPPGTQSADASGGGAAAAVPRRVRSSSDSDSSLISSAMEELSEDSSAGDAAGTSGREGQWAREGASASPAAVRAKGAAAATAQWLKTLHSTSDETAATVLPPAAAGDGQSGLVRAIDQLLVQQEALLQPYFGTASATASAAPASCPLHKSAADSGNPSRPQHRPAIASSASAPVTLARTPPPAAASPPPPLPLCAALAAAAAASPAAPSPYLSSSSPCSPCRSSLLSGPSPHRPVTFLGSSMAGSSSYSSNSDTGSASVSRGPSLKAMSSPACDTGTAGRGVRPASPLGVEGLAYYDGAVAVVSERPSVPAPPSVWAASKVAASATSPREVDGSGGGGGGGGDMGSLGGPFQVQLLRQPRDAAAVAGGGSPMTAQPTPTQRAGSGRLPVVSFREDVAAAGAGAGATAQGLEGSSPRRVVRAPATPDKAVAGARVEEGGDKRRQLLGTPFPRALATAADWATPPAATSSFRRREASAAAASAAVFNPGTSGVASCDRSPWAGRPSAGSGLGGSGCSSIDASRVGKTSLASAASNTGVSSVGSTSNNSRHGLSSSSAFASANISLADDGSGVASAGSQPAHTSNTTTRPPESPSWQAAAAAAAAGAWRRSPGGCPTGTSPIGVTFSPDGRVAGPGLKQSAAAAAYMAALGVPGTAPRARRVLGGL